MLFEKKKYYKALLKEPYMTSKYGNMKYEIGKKYKIDGKLTMCCNGFHYVDDISILPRWYRIGTYDVFEVKPSGKISHDKIDEKYCSEKIVIDHKLSYDELQSLYIDIAKSTKYNDVHVRYLLAHHIDDTFYLDDLARDKSSSVRAVIASRNINKYLNILVHDDCTNVLEEVLKCGRKVDLDILVKNKNSYIRYIIADIYGDIEHLNILKNSGNRSIKYCAKKRLEYLKDIE